MSSPTRVVSPPRVQLAPPKQDGLPPAYCTSAQTLLRRYENLDLTPRQIQTAAYTVWESDTRFSTNESPYLAPVYQKAPSTEDKRLYNSLPKSQRVRLEKHLADDLVGLTLRPPERVQISRGNLTSVQFEQRYAHTQVEAKPASRVWSLKEGYTLSSEVAKKDDRPINSHSLEHCANSGYISANHTMLAWRSARCDTPMKLEENLVGSCCASLSTAGGDKSKARGWKLTEQGTWEYHPILVTAMDKSFVKHLFELIRSLFGGEKRTERARLQAIGQARDSVFFERNNSGKYYNIEVDGKPERVFIRAPQVVNVVLSSQANRPGALREARSDNFAAAAKLGEELAQTLRKRGEQGDADLVDQFRNTPLAEMPALLQNSEYREQVALMRPSLRLGLEWLHLLLAKSTLDGNELTHRTDPGVEVLLLKHLLDETNIAASIGCKSGVDRTPVKGALFSASHAYEAEHGVPYDPLHATLEQTTAMRDLFTEFADAWAKPVVELTRGKRSTDGGIKWDSHPVARHWYDPSQGRLEFGKVERSASRPSPQTV